MKSVICYLCKSIPERITSLKKSLDLLYINYKFIKHSDVFIFVESNFPEKEKIILVL